MSQVPEIKDYMRQGWIVTLVGVVVNVVLIVIQLFAAILSHSQALMVDTIHSTADLFTTLVALAGLKLGYKKPDETHPFGHGRLETLATLIVGLCLILVAAGFGFQAVHSLVQWEYFQPGAIAVLAAFIAIVSKEILFHYSLRVGKRLSSPVLIANAWHHRSDAFSSIAVLLGVGAAQVSPSWWVCDPIAALVVAFMIAKVGAGVIWQSVREFIDTAPDGRILEQIRACAILVEGVRGIHDVKVRSSGGKYMMEIHVVVDGQIKVKQGHRIAKEVEACVFEGIKNVSSVIVHIDPEKAQENLSDRMES